MRWSTVFRRRHQGNVRVVGRFGASVWASLEAESVFSCVLAVRRLGVLEVIGKTVVAWVTGQAVVRPDSVQERSQA
jgi:hypothetical protein